MAPRHLEGSASGHREPYTRSPRYLQQEEGWSLRRRREERGVPQLQEGNASDHCAPRTQSLRQKGAKSEQDCHCLWCWSQCSRQAGMGAQAHQEDSASGHHGAYTPRQRAQLSWEHCQCLSGYCLQEERWAPAHREDSASGRHEVCTLPWPWLWSSGCCRRQSRSWCCHRGGRAAGAPQEGSASGHRGAYTPPHHRVLRQGDESAQAHRAGSASGHRGRYIRR